ncbi:hypothetical protein WA026_009188 [Henosepilachna vigintioctopunctata]|uniref:Lipase domain-containing protein n=1 Tax=Henosepilachna vigintioctopunctata TaxID=420089 RepID=A0AAW1UN43_9CUCU
MQSFLNYLVFLNYICFSYAGLNYSTVQFLLATKETRTLDITDLSKPRSLFRPNSEIIVIVPGWTECTTLPWVEDMTKAYFDRTDMDYQIIAVEWGYEANGWYYHVASIVDVIGVFVGDWLIRLAETEGFDLGRYHIVSNSIGCQVAGYLGKYVKKKSGRLLHRITALDAAGPGFFFKGPEERLNKGDAEIIVALHTDCGWKGITIPFADVDLYPNGGIHPQPGCIESKLALEYITEPCSHRRARLLWVESIGKRKFTGTKCDSWESYTKGACDGNEKLDFTGDMRSIKKEHSGLYFTKTNSEAPLIID